MKQNFKSLLKLILIAICFISQAHASQPAGSASPQTDFSDKEIEKLVAPIALYPDLLLQHVLAASTFPEQILDAAIYNEQAKDPQKIKVQPWDESVKAVANYPSILSKMAGDLDWTISLGIAFINQNPAVKKVIQNLRAKAKAVGNLKDSNQQEVIEDSAPDGTKYIRIEPTDTQVIYVPTYTNTTVVYQEPVKNNSSYLAPLATFGLGLALGSALDDDDDYHYYGGGGYYGPGFWSNQRAFDSWVDYRNDRWDDAYDYARDRQDWRQNNADDWREYRQDLGRKQSEWNQQVKSRASGMSPEQRAKAQSEFQNRQQTFKNRDGGEGNFSRTSTINSGNFDKNAAQQRLNQARNNPELQQRAETVRANPNLQQRAANSGRDLSQRPSGSHFSGQDYSKGAGLSGMRSGSATANRSFERGQASRNLSGSGRNFSSSRPSGSFSAGGGAIRAGGGGRRR